MNLLNIYKQTPISNLNFESLNQLVLKEPHNMVKQLNQQNMNDLELKVIVLKKVLTFQPKDKQTIHRFLVADNSASIYANFYGTVGEQIQEADILYINNAYTMVYKNELILVEGKNGIVLKIGQIYFLYDDSVNMSRQFNK